MCSDSSHSQFGSLFSSQESHIEEHIAPPEDTTDTTDTTLEQQERQRLHQVQKQRQIALSQEEELRDSDKDFVTDNTPPNQQTEESSQYTVSLNRTPSSLSSTPVSSVPLSASSTDQEASELPGTQSLPTEVPQKLAPSLITRSKKQDSGSLAQAKVSKKKVSWLPVDVRKALGIGRIYIDLEAPHRFGLQKTALDPKLYEHFAEEYSDLMSSSSSESDSSESGDSDSDETQADRQPVSR